MPLAPGAPRHLEHIGLDVDGVLRDLASHLVLLFEREYPHLMGQHLPIARWPDWGGFDRYFPSGIDFLAFRKSHFRELWLEAPCYPGVQSALGQLTARYTLHIVTHQPSERSAQLTREWLDRNGIQVPAERIHVTGQKDTAPVQVLVDDMIHNLEAAQLAGMVPICRTQPWNEAWDGFRVESLEEVCRILDCLESG